jgi:hypothetical protein
MKRIRKRQIQGICLTAYMRRYRRTDEVHTTSIISLEPSNKKRTGFEISTCLLVNLSRLASRTGRFFVFFQCRICHRLWSKRLCMYRTACAQYRLCFYLAFLPFLLSTSRGRSAIGFIDGWLAGVQWAPNWDGVL